MEKILKLYSFESDGSGKPFPSSDEQIEISSFRYDAKRMGAAPTISCSIHHKRCLDNDWSKDVYVNFRNEKYYLKQTPTSSYSNSSVMYKHDAEFVSERSILDNVYFYDVVNENEVVDRVVSNSTSFNFSGDIHEFATRLNKSLTRLNVGYSVVVDSGIDSDVKLVEFDNKYITEALQEIDNTYNLKYYFVGKEIHIGEQQNIINKVFKYGSTESLLSISKNNANSKIINRITGIGSSDNIPFYYPNDDEKGVTRVLLNGYPDGVSIADTVKYRRVKSTDKFVFKGNTEYTVSLIGGAKKVLGNVYFIGDPEAQKNGYEVDFYYQIELEEGEKVKISVSSSHSETRSLSYELIKTNGVNYGVNTSENTFSLSRGTYNIIVRWRFLVDEPFRFEEEAFNLIDEYIDVKADIVVASNNVWTLNNIPINLESYGISLSHNAKDTDEITIERLLYIHPQKHLMPSIYRSSKGEKRFYNAENNTYQDDDGRYYKFENLYSSRHPKEHIETLDDIKPSIKNVKNNLNQYIDRFIDFEYDDNDNDEVNENNEFIHPYFYAKLNKFDGKFGFNLFDHAIESNEMTISMTSGSCASCEFTIMVDPDTQKNKVLVDDNGDLLRDTNGNVRMGTPLDKQNDTINNYVWIALKKDINTYGVIMPNASNKYRPSTNDKFVILNIDLPKVYVTQAEQKLEKELIKYMYENNSEKFNFSISFSRIFFAENQDILETLNENSKITIEYNGNEYDLYVSNFSYSVDSNSALPDVKIELSDVVTVSQNQISKIVTATKKEIIAKTEQYTTTTAEVKRLSTSIETEIQNIKDELYKPRPESSTQGSNSVPSVDGLLEIKNDLNGIQYLFSKLPIAIQGGVTFYAQDDNIHIPTIAEGLPFDGVTIKYNYDTKKIEVIGGTGGGSGSVTEFWMLSNIPQWITEEKPVAINSDGTTSDFATKNDLSYYATQRWVADYYVPWSEMPNLTDTATKTWVSQQGYIKNHQAIYKLSFESGDFTKTQNKSFTANSAENTINIPTTTDHIKEGSKEFFTNEKAIKALGETLKKYVNLSDYQEIEGIKHFKNGLTGTNWVIGSDASGNPFVKFTKNGDWYVKYINNTMVIGKNNAQLIINQYGHVEIAGGATINGNMLVKGGVSFYSTNGSVTPFLIDVASVDKITSTSTTQVYTANAVKLLKEALANTTGELEAVKTKLENASKALVGIESKTTIKDITTALAALRNSL